MVRVQKVKDKRPLSLLCKEGCSITQRSKTEERKESAEDLDDCMLLLVDMAQPPKEVVDAQLLVDRFSPSEPTSCDADGVYM